MLARDRTFTGDWLREHVDAGRIRKRGLDSGLRYHPNDVRRQIAREWRRHGE